jgi:iron complex transport system substrate-binding protein
MRIVSLLPSATEILFALGLGEMVVGVSHECDFPEQARSRRTVIHSRIPHGATPLEIDRIVREYVARGESLYSVDAQALAELGPDLIVTQDLCHVCAASPDDLAAALARFARRPRILSLNPQDLGDVWRDILAVGFATGQNDRAERLVQDIGTRLGAVQEELEDLPEILRPRVALLEWLQPFYVGGHWIPEMIHLAGAKDVFGQVRKPSFQIGFEDLVESRPEIILVAPCGYGAAQASEEYSAMPLPPEWGDIPAVRANQVYACEANSYFSRPGPRLIDGIEAMAKLFHEREGGWKRAGPAMQRAIQRIDISPHASSARA